MDYYVIGDEDTVLGFRLVGVDGETANNASEAENAFSHALKRENIGIIVMTERVAETIRPTVDRYTFSEDFPLIVEIPDKTGRLPGRPLLRELVNNAIGIKV